jgi:hypothetical protein
MMQQRAASDVFFLTAMMGVLASAYETRIGMIAAYVLFVGSVLSFFSKAKWCLWLPLVGSSVLAFYVLPAEVRNVLMQPSIFGDGQGIVLDFTLVTLVLLSLGLSIRLFAKASARKAL